MAFEKKIWFDLVLNYLHLNTNITYNSFFYADHSKGFGGKFGVQTDRVDKSAVGWEHKEQLQQHESQKGEDT